MYTGSYFYIDVFVPHPFVLYRPSQAKLQTIEFFDTAIKQDTTIYETLSYNKATEIASIHWEYTSKAKGIYQKFPFKMKMYSPETMKQLLFDTGFYVKNIWGGYDCSSLAAYSALQIYECTLQDIS